MVPMARTDFKLTALGTPFVEMSRFAVTNASLYKTIVFGSEGFKLHTLQMKVLDFRIDHLTSL